MEKYDVYEWLNSTHRAFESLSSQELQILFAMSKDKWCVRKTAVLSQRLCLAKSTVNYHLRRLEALSNPLTTAIPCTPKIGLARYALYLEPLKPVDELLDTIGSKPFLQSLTASTDSHIVATFAVPTTQASWLFSFLDYLEINGAVRKPTAYLVDDTTPVFPYPKWYSAYLKTWKSGLDGFLEDVTKLEDWVRTRMDYSTVTIPDRLDLEIIQQLELNGRVSLIRIASKIGVTLSCASRRVSQVLEGGLIGRFTIRVLPFSLNQSDLFDTRILLVKNSHKEPLTKKISSHPFILSVCHGITTPLVIIRAQVPWWGRLHYLRLLERLVEAGLARSVKNECIIPSTIRNFTICPKFFMDNEWKTPTVLPRK